MKKFIALIMAGAIGLSLIACGSSKSSTGSSGSSGSAEAKAESGGEKPTLFPMVKSLLK